jgi:altered-inheritance-of-mitochondria protein 13
VAAELKRIQEAETAALNEKLSLPPVDESSDTTPSRDFVNKEVEALKKKLESRRKVREIPDSVESARSDVVRCLRDNDRRPLDCWKEVETFKEEVRRLEKGWVDKVVS